MFEPSTIVGYELAIHDRVYGFVFRTLAEVDPLAVAIAGVRPAVRLLITATTRRQLARLHAFLTALRATAAGSPNVSDALLLRAASSIFSRRPLTAVTAALRSMTG